MHSRIYQISKEPIQNFISEDRYYEGFVGSHADYVSEVEYKSDDYLNDLKWLQNATEGLEVNIKEGTITITSKKEYFAKKHEDFQKLIEELSDVTLEEFSSGKLEFKISDLKCAYDDKYSFYADDNDEYTGLTTLDNWVRNAEEGEVYYIGTIIEYHF